MTGVRSGRMVCAIAVIGIAFLVLPVTLPAQPPPTLPNPRLNWMFPVGGRAGSTFELTVTGDDLDDARELRFDHQGIHATRKMVDPGLGQAGPQSVEGAFLVTIDADVTPGVYDVRVLGRYGLSTPRAFTVGSGPEMNETEPNNVLAQAQRMELGITINGTCEPSGHDYFRFAAKKGERVIIDCRAFRIDSRLDGTLILFDANGKELERSHNVNRRDPLIDFSVPADGDYIVSLHEQSYGYYAFPGELFYRLTISTAPYIDFLFPPCGLAGSTNSYTLYGRNLPGGKLVPGVEVFGRPLEAIPVEITLPKGRSLDLVREAGLLVEPSESFLDGITYRLKSDQGFSNPLLVTTSQSPVIVEQEPNDLPQQAPMLSVPCEYIGQFYPRGDRDWVSFAAKKDEVLSIEVISQRLGLSTDPRMVLQQVKRDANGMEQVVDLQTVDDDLGNADRTHWSYLDSILFSTNTHDPVCKFVAPDDGIYRMMVQDLSRPTQDLARSAKGNARHVYRLSIRPPEPDFRLVYVPRPPTNLPAEIAATTVAWAPTLQPGGATLVEVYAHRRDGFDGEIHVTADHLPPGVTALPIVIAPKQASATLVLKASTDAASGIGEISIQGKATRGHVELVRAARPAAMIWAVQLTGVTYHRSRLADRFPICVAPIEPPPFALSADPDLKLVTSLAGTVKFSVSMVRRDSFKGPLELFVYGLPPTIHGPLHAQPKYHTPITIPADQSSTEFTLTVPNYVPPGTYTFFLSGVGTANYARNPEKLKAFENRLAAIETIVAENESKLKAAQEAQAAAAKALADAQSTQQDLPSRQEAKAAADKAASEIDSKSKADMTFLTTFRQEVTTLRDKSKPVDLKISAPSNRVTITITPTPFELQLGANAISVQPGTKGEVPIKVNRLYGSNDPVNVQFMGGFKISGINAPIVTIPAGQSEGKLIIEVYASTPASVHASEVRASTTYNGQPLSTQSDLKFVIDKK